jgi:hypothetical protein
MNKKPFQARQGDVFLEKITSIPEGAEVKKDNIVAVGESQNHAHAVFGQVEILEKGNDIFLSVKEDSELRHILMANGISTENWTKEHTEIKLQPGCYKVTLQRQYDPYEKAIVAVRD